MKLNWNGHLRWNKRDGQELAREDREIIADTLFRLNCDCAVTFLNDALIELDPWSRVHIIDQISMMPTRRALECIARFVNDENEMVREAAISSLRAAGFLWKLVHQSLEWDLLTKESMIVFEQVPDRIRTDISSAPKLSDETFALLRDFIYSKTGIYFPEKRSIWSKEDLRNVCNYSMSLVLRIIFNYWNMVSKEKVSSNSCAILWRSMRLLSFEMKRKWMHFNRNLPWKSLTPRKTFGKRILRIWSAACSSGEEPYTLAMLYLEYLKPRYPDLQIEIIGTDINTAVVDMARTAGI